MSQLTLTDKAKKQLTDMDVTRKEFLRLWVGEGGCSGMSYQAVLDSNETPFDEILYEDQDLRILSDKNSAEYLKGITIDYSDDLINSGFMFKNPNAVKTCGCGNSFQA